MVVSKMNDIDVDSWEDCGDFEDFPDHLELKERLRKTLYYGKTPRMDCPSLPMTEFAVDYFHDTVPRGLGRVDMYWASSVSKKASISPCAMMLGMLYIDRLRNKDPDYLAKISSEELFLVSMMLASKYLYDEGITEEVYNDEWADSANLDVEDINEIERDFLTAIDWNLFVGEDEFNRLLDAVEGQVALRETDCRGTLTYSELLVLIQAHNIHTHHWGLLRDICKVFAVCSLAYTAGGLTLLGAHTTLDVLRAELSRTRPLTFDLTPITLLVQHYSDGAATWLPSSLHVPVTSMADLLLPRTGIHDAQLPRPSIDDVQESPDGSQLDGSCEKKSRTSSFLSQFLTLTLVKDTLITFVMGMRLDGGNSSETPRRCHCHVCPLNVKPTSRRNKTYHHALPSSGHRPADTNWQQLKKPLPSTTSRGAGNPGSGNPGGCHNPGHLGVYHHDDVFPGGGGDQPANDRLPWKPPANQCSDERGGITGERYVTAGAYTTLLL